MTSGEATAPLASAVTGGSWLSRWGPLAIAALAFGILFARPFVLLLDDWWNNPDAGSGLLLAPVAGWLIWRSRREITFAPQPALGAVLLVSAVLLRFASGLASELFTMRFSMLMALIALAVGVTGLRQVVKWWLPVTLLGLTIPLPEVIINSIALPLQLQASQMGAAMLETRYVPVRLSGNVILLPGHRLFVTEACSGLRSLTALLSLGVLAGGLWLKSPITRLALLASAIPVAVALNGIRVFLTGFLVFFVDPEFGEGFMHLTEGWLLFVVAFGLLGLMAWLMAVVEAKWLRRE